MPFTLPLEDDHHVKVSEDLLSLRFNLRIGSMYVEQEMYSTNGDILETILIRRTCVKMVMFGFWVQDHLEL